jgi:hypothetical protein
MIWVENKKIEIFNIGLANHLDTSDANMSSLVGTTGWIAPVSE